MSENIKACSICGYMLRSIDPQDDTINVIILSKKHYKRYDQIIYNDQAHHETLDIEDRVRLGLTNSCHFYCPRCGTRGEVDDHDTRKLKNNLELKRYQDYTILKQCKAWKIFFFISTCVMEISILSIIFQGNINSTINIIISVLSPISIFVIFYILLQNIKKPFQCRADMITESLVELEPIP
jgi:hypothetical protein